MIQSFEFRAMNTTVMLAAEGTQAAKGMHETKNFIDECEQRFSRFLAASELSELNCSAGNWLQVSDELMDMVQTSMTNGLFDPSILPDLKLVGYDRSMDEIRATGAAILPHASNRTSRPALHQIQFALADNRVLLPRGVEIDQIGRATHLLRSYSDVCAVSAGGDILFTGHPFDGMDWDVNLEDPRDPTQILVRLRIPPGAVATSSITKRTWLQGEKVRHHLIDPRTGESAKTNWLSVTIITPDILTAEVYAKVLLIGGDYAVSNLLDNKPDVTFIAVKPDGELTGSSHYKDYIYELAPDTFLSAAISH